MDRFYPAQIRAWLSMRNWISRTLPLTITKAMSGEGRVSPLLLREQTELALPKQIFKSGEKQQLMTMQP